MEGLRAVVAWQARSCGAALEGNVYKVRYVCMWAYVCICVYVRLHTCMSVGVFVVDLDSAMNSRIFRLIVFKACFSEKNVLLYSRKCKTLNCDRM